MAKHDLKIDIRTSPYIRKAPTVAQIMRNVVYALLPLAIYSVYHFGISVFLIGGGYLIFRILYFSYFLLLL